MASGTGRDGSDAQSQSGIFAAMFDEHAAHLLDYCDLLLADHDQAAAATKVTLVTGTSLIWCLRDRGRLRPWLFGLARRECLSAEPARAHLARLGLPGPEAGEPDTGALRLAEIAAEARRAAVAVLVPLEREIPELVYRHGISAAEIPALLGISAARAVNVLAGVAAARADLDATGPEAGVMPGVLSLAELTAIPVAPVPGSLWHDAARLMLDPNLRPARDAILARVGELDRDGFPAGPAAPQPSASQRPALRRRALRRRVNGTRPAQGPAAGQPSGRRSARTIALLTLPAVAGLAGVLFFGHLAIAEKYAQRSAHPAALATPSASAAPKSSQPPIESLFPRTARPGRTVKHQQVTVPSLTQPTTPVVDSPTGSPSPSQSTTASPPRPSASPSTTSPSPHPSPSSPSPSPTATVSPAASVSPAATVSPAASVST